MRKRTVGQYAEALYEITAERSGKDLERVIKIFIESLRKDRMLSKIDIIIDSFIKFSKKQNNIEEIEVTAARKVNEDLAKKICAIFGKSVEMKERVDKGIIGGFIVRKGGTIIDASVRTQLKQLRKQMTK